MDISIILTLSLAIAAVAYSFVKRREIDSMTRPNQNSFTYDAVLDINSQKPNYYRLTQVLVGDLDNVNLRQASINKNDLRVISDSKKMVENGFVDERMFTKIRFLHSMYTRN